MQIDLAYQKPILVTGATGYVGSHTVKQLLEQGYKVRGTVRSLANQEKNKFLYELVPGKNSNLELVEADLIDPTSWLKAVEGCDYILHIASPIMHDVPKDENEQLIKPAVEGTLNVLNAAVKKGVKKVVITSGCLAAMVGNEGQKVTPNHWSNEALCDGYTKSKIRAEKAAWEFYKEHKGQIEITTLLPGFIMGPVFKPSGASSEHFITRIMTGKMPAMPNICAATTDVRNVAEAHIKAAFSPNTDGKRYILNYKSMWMKDMAEVLSKEFKQYGYKIPSGTVPDWVMCVAAVFNKQAKSAKPLLGHYRDLDSSQTDQDLKINYIPFEKSLTDLAYSLINFGVIPDKIHKKNE